MSRADVVHLVLVLLTGCVFVFALESVASPTGGYLASAFALLPPRASLPCETSTTPVADLENRG